MAVILGQAPRDEVDPDLVVPVIYMAQLKQLVARWGVTPEALLAGTGLTPDIFEDPERRVSVLWMRQVILNALALTREPGLGFYFGLQLKLSSHGAVGFAAMTSATLRDALAIAERFFSLRAGHISVRFSVEADLARVELVEMVPLQELRVFLIESLITGLVQMSKTILGRTISGRVEVAYPEPDYFQGFSHLWTGPARFGQSANVISFPAEYLEAPLQMADEVAMRQAVEQCERELATLGETSSLLSSVRRQLRLRRNSYPSLTELAAERHVSPRTLKRQLAEHGTSFRQLLDELRRDRALDLLEDPALTTDAIAEKLGYSDASNFHRAFRRWVGVSPSAWREGQALAREKNR